MAGDYFIDYGTSDHDQFWSLVASGRDSNVEDLLSYMMEPGTTRADQQAAYELLADWIESEYDIVLDDVWDWEEYRKNTDS